MSMDATKEMRPAREIVTYMGNKAIFAYVPGMEIRAMEADYRTSLDKIACYFHEDQFTISDLYIGYAVSLYRFTIPKVVAATIQVFGKMWPEKHVPKNIDRDALRNRMKRMCSMGMLRRFSYVIDEKQIVLYSTTPEFSKVIYQSLKIATDARPEKVLIPPVEILGHAACSLVTSELMQSYALKEFNFMPRFRYQDFSYGFNCKLDHEINGVKYTTIVEPIFTRLDTKRFTKEEWNSYLKAKANALYSYAEYLEKKEETRVQIIIVCEDKEDFLASATMMCNIFPDTYLERIYYTAEGAIKSGENLLTNAMIRVTSLHVETDGVTKRPESVSASLAYRFF